LFSRKQQSHSRSDVRERIGQARQAAEALFTKPRVAMPSVSELSKTVKTARKPRVLPMISPPLVPVLPDQAETAIAPSPPAGEIPGPQLARIRGWVKYGMTIAQVAQVYGVAVAEIERILRYP